MGTYTRLVCCFPSRAIVLGRSHSFGYIALSAANVSRGGTEGKIGCGVRPGNSVHTTKALLTTQEPLLACWLARKVFLTNQHPWGTHQKNSDSSQPRALGHRLTERSTNYHVHRNDPERRHEQDSQRKKDVLERTRSVR